MNVDTEFKVLVDLRTDLIKQLNEIDDQIRDSNVRSAKLEYRLSATVKHGELAANGLRDTVDKREIARRLELSSRPTDEVPQAVERCENIAFIERNIRDALSDEQNTLNALREKRAAVAKDFTTVTDKIDRLNQATR